MRPTCENRPVGSAAARVAMLTCVALGGLSAAALPQGGGKGHRPQPISLLTNEDPASPGSFTLTFDDFGFETSGGITSTQYLLRIDHRHRTASFVEYLQHVEPLTLPGGISTGDITVEIVEGSSSGTYDPKTRTFTTSEQYAVYFTGDLSAFGLTSPVILPSSSTGAIAIDPVLGGGVTMNWEGEGEIGDPSNPLKFHYQCQVNTVYPPAPDNLISVGVVSDVVNLQLFKPIERTLLSPLDYALYQVQQGKSKKAVHGLKHFENRVTALRGWVIPDAEADALISNAEAIISLLGG